jgi:hypothetical protein
MVSTSLAVAWLVSAWLVPPYLALMAAILFAPSGRRNEAAETRPDFRPGEDLAKGEPGAFRDVVLSSMEPAAPVDPSLALAPSESSVALSRASPVKAGRGKGRGRIKKAKGVVEPAATDATWIRIGPGKFVRADTPRSAAPIPEPSSTLPDEPDSIPPAPTFEAGLEERTESPGNEALPAVPIRDEPEGPPAPILDEPPPECAEVSPWPAPEPVVPGEEPIPPGKDDASDGVPEPEIATDERLMAGTEVLPPTLPEPLDALDPPEPVCFLVAPPSEPEPALLTDEPAPAEAEVSPWPAPGVGLSMVEEQGQPPVVDEGDAELEKVETARARDPNPERVLAVEELEDNGNAPDAPTLHPQAEPATPLPSRTTGTLLRSLSGAFRGAWRHGTRPARGSRHAPSPTGRGVRRSRRHRGSLDLRLRCPARREPRRSRQPRRAFPPRSPPVGSRPYFSSSSCVSTKCSWAVRDGLSHPQPHGESAEQARDRALVPKRGSRGGLEISCCWRSCPWS